MIAPSCSLIGLRAAFLAALGLSACTSRALDDVGSGGLDTTATADPPATATGAPTTGEPGATTAATTGGVVTTGAETTTAATTATTSGATTTSGTSGESDSGGTTTTGVDVSTSGTTDAGTSTTGTPDLPCVSIESLGTTLLPGDVIELPGCGDVPATDCHDYIKICAPLPDGAISCEQCAPDCIGALPQLCNGFIRGGAVCGPFGEGEQCCQVFEYGWNCTDGRPFCVDGEARVAPAIAGDAWCGELRTGEPRTDHPRSGGGGPTLLAELAPHERAGLAALWTADGLAEHASVAAFARFTLQLTALGAPAELVADACRAQLDEVGHARTTLALAAAYGRPVGPGPLAVGGALDASSDREAVLVATFIEGCVGETIAAAELELAAESCADPAVAAVLRAVAADEQRHAALAWRTVQWLLQDGGGALRGALAQALAGVRSPAPTVDTLPAALLRRHGRLPADERVALAEQCLRAVIRPCVAALLGAADQRVAA